MVTSDVDVLPSPWLAALADPPGQEVPLPEALVRAEDVWGHGAAGAHPQGEWNLLSRVTCDETGRKNELATYLLSVTSVHVRKHRQQLLDSSVPKGCCSFAPRSVTFSYHGGFKTVICFVLIFREDKSTNS